ncbi:AbrB/MazE/SpoVT family DNA-binding domain-containing protein [Sporosarcina sp. E16_8]|uniref:AbrB/MazE/SpoVT family DNA-binding domain-containing protein n=1 Tax=Sporosarcina sp. E16_8 TaxID=2789295 RepID=UPI001A929685|nr:AbrB/MazE/SpoVT family DNA-binding domain-containing protein [Sporosarcina sp. E16_8]MBO0589438.1 AbrB/MazE/SpoVT family DNA-binding domain-containing protein [Sporosarcina sp. E16_8]
MKSTGVVRKVDPLGRIVIPKELRKTMNINEGDPMEIFVDNDLILFKKYNAQGACLVTGEVLNENIEFSPGLILSPKGAEILFSKLKASYEA